MKKRENSLKEFIFSLILLLIGLLMIIYEIFLLGFLLLFIGFIILLFVIFQKNFRLLQLMKGEGLFNKKRAKGSRGRNIAASGKGYYHD